MQPDFWPNKSKCLDGLGRQMLVVRPRTAVPEQGRKVLGPVGLSPPAGPALLRSPRWPSRRGERGDRTQAPAPARPVGPPAACRPWLLGRKRSSHAFYG